jgi:hypothetical protein
MELRRSFGLRVGVENSVRSGSGQIAGAVDGIEVSQPCGLGSGASASAVVRKR